MPAQPVPIERLQARSINGRTLGGRELEVHDVSGMERLEAPPMPEGLGEQGQLEWAKIWYAGKWLWPDQDYHWVEQVCRAYDDMATFRHEVDRMGLTVEGYAGQTVANPLIKEIRALEKVIRDCLSTLGFSPTDRARLKLTDMRIQKTAQDLVNNGTKRTNLPDIEVEYVEGEW